MKTFFTESVVLPDQKVAVDHVPFGEGQDVAVFMMAIERNFGAVRTANLEGSIIRYDDPFEAVSQTDWETGA